MEPIWNTVEATELFVPSMVRPAFPPVAVPFVLKMQIKPLKQVWDAGALAEDFAQVVMGRSKESRLKIATRFAERRRGKLD